jgi:hypothetical protein
MPDNGIVSMVDSYGDGWNGNVLTIGDASYTLFAEDGAEGSATVGECGPPVVPGCTDVDALNYNADANEDDGSCEYPVEITGALSLQGVLDLTVPSGGSDGKAIHLVATSDIADLSVFGIGVANNGGGTDGQEYTFDPISVLAGDDILLARTPDAMIEYFGDCISEFEHVITSNSSISQNGDDAIELFEQGEVIETFGDIDTDGTGTDWEYMDSWAYMLDGTWIFGGVNCSDGSETTQISTCPYPLCPVVDIYGCMDPSADNYNADATMDDESCEFGGCTDVTYVEYDSSANTDDGSCSQTWADLAASLQEQLDNVDITVDNADAYAEGVASVDITVDNADAYAEGAASVDITVDNADAYADGVASVDITVDNADAYADGVASVDITVDNADAYADGVASVDITVDNADAYAEGAASVTPEDGIGQADVDAAYAEGAASVDITVDNADAYAEGAASVDITVDNADAYAEGAASVTPEDGIGQADVDAAYAEGAASVDITVDNQASFDAGAASVDITVDNADVYDEGYAEGSANCSGGTSDPIFIDIVEGWNILGYTLPFPQDVAATVADIVDNILIVKNNNADVYWPEFGFNGIGDFTPGQGYQIKTTAAISQYTWPNVDGQRIELTPNVPDWAIEMEADIHPNDIRTLVKVVNMLGQEVNLEDQFSGEVLLYLYNDGTVEKKIVK